GGACHFRRLQDPRARRAGGGSPGDLQRLAGHREDSQRSPVIGHPAGKLARDRLECAARRSPGSPRMPAVSFIIPTMDRAGELAEALASLRAQTASDWEALVVDDASTEDIAGLIRSLDDDRIRHVPLPPDRSGAPAGRN